MESPGGWRVLLAVCGCGGLALYGLAAFGNLPDRAALAAVFLVGPLIGVSLLAAARVLQRRGGSALIETGGLLGLGAGCMLLAMLAVQLGMAEATIPRGKSAEFAGQEAAARLVARAVNDAQLSLDVAWDTLVCAAVALMCLATVRRSAVGGAWSAVGLGISVGGWGLQIGTFPIPPAEAGYFDFGPVLAGWMLVAGVGVLLNRGQGNAAASI